MMQYEETNPNWTNVKVAGLSKAVRIAFEDVLVRADDQYHIMQSACRKRRDNQHGAISWDGMAGRWAYNQLPREWSTKRISDLVGVLAHASGAHAVDSHADAAPFPVVP